MQYQIRDASPFKYFAMIPNMVDDLGLSPHAYRLYGHLKRVAGEDGRCFQNTKQLSETCRMSVGMITKAKKELMESMPPLISIALTNHPIEGKFSYHEITILNIWPENIQKYGSQYEQSVHNMNSGRSQYEQYGSQYEPKNNPIKKQEKKNKEATPSAPDTLSSLDYPKALLNTPFFIVKWREWWDYRKEIKKPLKATTAKKQLAFLETQGRDAVEVLEQSMVNGWTGLFPLKKNGHPPTKSAAPPQYAEEH